jgi:hypothetical protein
LKIDAASLGLLDEGTYTVVLIGRNFAYYDTIQVPTYAPDTNFQFRITAIDLLTHQPISNLPIELCIGDSAQTKLVDTTDLSGTASIVYDNYTTDTIAYDIYAGHGLWPTHYGQTQAAKGIPEVITLGISE